MDVVWFCVLHCMCMVLEVWAYDSRAAAVTTVTLPSDLQPRSPTNPHSLSRLRRLVLMSNRMQ